MRPDWLLTLALAAGDGVTPELPALWAVPTGRATIDYAEAAQADAWLRHPIFGDPSFDAFERLGSNPIVEGEPPFLWPVNGSLFEDPASGHWYAYVGHYHEGYALQPGEPVTHCRVYRSTDEGVSWTPLGPIFDDPTFRFEGDAGPANIAPDVTVVYADGRYHLAYDWATDNTTWANAGAPAGGADSGCAYAWCERPEGPFHRCPRPILRTSDHQRRFPADGKYRRVYATSLVRRRHDWLALTLVDSGPFYAWGLLAMTAVEPTGPWSEPVLLGSPESDLYHPAPVEGFPAFEHDGFVYSPMTSVGANRNFQVLYRAPLESAHRADAWTLWQHGSVWHAASVPHEGFGIWGQTFSGFVDAAGQFRVLFPSRRWPGGAGTINLATRPWSRPFRERGFVVSAHSAPSLTLTRAAYRSFRLECDVVVRGTAVRLLWGYRAPLAYDGRADGRLAALSRTRHAGLELRSESWRLVSADETVAEGALPLVERRRLSMEVGEGRCALSVDHGAAWEGALPTEAGPLGLLLEPGTHVTVDHFAVEGEPAPATWTWAASEAIGGAGVNEEHIRRIESPAFRYGQGILCDRPGERVKWCFRGRGLRLWSPRGPAYGPCRLALNGRPIGELDLHATEEQPSTVVFERHGLPDAFHALAVTGTTAPLPVDCLEAVQ